MYRFYFFRMCSTLLLCRILIPLPIYSAILSLLQIESAINDPVTVYLALTSMICALMSLIYGCIYIIRLGSMRKVSKAAMWAAVSPSILVLLRSILLTLIYDRRLNDRPRLLYGMYGSFWQCRQHGWRGKLLSIKFASQFLTTL